VKRSWAAATGRPARSNATQRPEPVPAPPREHGGIRDPAWLLAVEPALHRLDDDVALVPGDVDRRAADVRRDEHVRELQEAIVGLQRLLGEDVERRPGEAARDEHLVERVLVGQRGARGVHEVGGGLHEREPLARHEVLRLRRHGRVQRDEVGLAQQVVERAHLHPGRRRVDVRIVGEDAGLEREEARRDLASDRAEPDEADRAAAELDPGEA
jgi:hypothetical protein